MGLEQREIRPFESVELLDDLCEGMRLIVGDQSVMPDSGLILEEDVYLRSGVRLRLAKDAESLRELIATLAGESGASPLGALDLTIADLEFVVISTSWFLRIVDIVDRRPLAELSSSSLLVDVSGSPRRKSLRSPNAGCEIVAMISLATSHPKKPLRPWRAGTWLARSSFSLSTAQSFNGFTPKPMDAAKKIELGLPNACTRFITMGKVSPLDEDTNEDSLELYVDEGLLASMSAMPRSKASKALQQQLFIDSVTAVARAARENRSDDVPDLNTCAWSDIEKSLIGKVITALAPKSTDAAELEKSCTGLLDVLRDEPARFVAHAEALAGILGSFNALMEN
jgi:hypothetical protein